MKTQDSKNKRNMQASRRWEDTQDSRLYSKQSRRKTSRRKRRNRRRNVVLIGGYIGLLTVLCLYLYSQMRPGTGSDYSPQGMNLSAQGQSNDQEISAPDLILGDGVIKGADENESEADSLGTQLYEPQSTPEILNLTGVINLEELYSPYAILVDAGTGQVLAEKNSDMRMYPASMTKLMAALVAVECTENWDASIEISQKLISRLYLEHASLAGFEPEEKVSPMDLLYGMLLPSGAECCSSYAIWLAGDEETFVGWMNDKAAELGMEGTHFTNTAGLHNAEHYSTAADMAILLEQCLQNETLRSVISAKSYQTSPTSKHLEGLDMQSTLFQTIEESPTLGEMLADETLSQVTLMGGKTGYTSQAGLCLASFARVGDREYLLVTAGAEGNHYTEPFHIEDALEVYGQLAQALQN